MKLNASQQGARIRAIFALEEAKGREALANHLALETERSVEEARSILAKSPKELSPVDTTDQVYDRYNAAHDPLRAQKPGGR